MQLLRQQFRPEFLNRVDEIILFTNLEKDQLKLIVQNYVGKLNLMLKDRGIALNFSKASIDWLCEKGYDRDFGARPMKRVFQKEVQDPLAKLLLEGKFTSGSQLSVDLRDEKIVFSTKKSGD